jgi:hypothetical protein
MPWLTLRNECRTILVSAGLFSAEATARLKEVGRVNSEPTDVGSAARRLQNPALITFAATLFSRFKDLEQHYNAVRQRLVDCIEIQGAKGASDVLLQE